MALVLRKSRKRPVAQLLDDEVENVYKFRILLPNGMSKDLVFREPGEEMLLDEFIHHVRMEVEKSTTEHGLKRNIRWMEDVYLEDMFGDRIRKKICFDRFATDKFHMLLLHDGAKETVHTFRNMWDLTPDTELLSELPAEYTFETALADLIDNSLQAVWSNCPNERRLISVTSDDHMISIFDSGQGMDGSDENSIVKWGKMGSSNHRHSRGSAIGGDPPYLMPFFGMYGYGGAVASMHLGRSAVVSSKTKKSKKVLTLALARDALLNNSGSGRIWRTDGGIRDPLEDEIQNAPHGSFTKVEIHGMKSKRLHKFQLQCRLKDIYFPYIQCDEAHTRKTTMPIEFQVNGVDLAEVEGGEVAVTNLHSCTGREFILQLRFSIKQDTQTSTSSGHRTSIPHREANARLKCVYFPIVEGKESIDRILEKLEVEECGVSENFDSFARVSIRRLGRLLPDARWGRFPFMEFRLKRGDKAHVLKRCCLRVKCFVETDAGFSPTVYKTDLAHQDPFTTALRNFGNKLSGKGLEMEAIVEIKRNGRLLPLSQLEKEYQAWLWEMHNLHDEEADCGEDQPVLVLVGNTEREKLGISSDVVRIHKVIKRRGVQWTSGDKIKVMKGAVGFQKKSLYAILEYIMLEGFQGDVGGEAWIICRPLGCLEANGCLLTINGESANLDIRKSLSIPISLIDSEKCIKIDDGSWMQQIEKLNQKTPARVDVLTAQECRQLEINEVLPMNSKVSAGYRPPRLILAVIRPRCFVASRISNSLDQKYIVKDDLEMSMKIKFIVGSNDSKGGEVIYLESSKQTVCKGVQGLYAFPLDGPHLSNLFTRAGSYKFSFAVTSGSQSICQPREFHIVVQPSDMVGSWELLCDERIQFSDASPLTVRVGRCVPRLSIASYDVYSNRMPFASLPVVDVDIKKNETVLFHANKFTTRLSSDKMTLEIMDILIECHDLDMIRPRFRVILELRSHDELFSIGVPCQVVPGHPHCVKIQPWSQLENHLRPGDVLQELILELLDGYDNHVEKGIDVDLRLTGFQIQDRCLNRKVDDQGYVNLSGLLKVTAFYGTNASLSLSTGGQVFFEKEFKVMGRELRAISEVPGFCNAGSRLENIVFGVFDSEGVIDESIHDQFHTLTVTSESFETDAVQYTFRCGKCTVPLIQVPLLPGIVVFRVFHSHHHELHTSFEINVLPDPKIKLPPPKLELLCLPEPDSGIDMSPCSDGRILTLQDPSHCSPMQLSPFVHSILDDRKKLDMDLTRVGSIIKDHEDKLQSLVGQRDSIRIELHRLQASQAASSEIGDLKMARERIIKQIEEKADNAASILSMLSNINQVEESGVHFLEGIVGIVALLGTVKSKQYSRILAGYLGESYMLATVCESYEAATALEASSVGKTINSLVICLDHIRPFNGKLKDDDPQKKLSLPDPQLPSGMTPPGFVGFAVNMINLDVHQISTRTSSGHGLRETLFYCLFGELQVYQSRQDMLLAKSYNCIKHGAVSLDGAIMKTNGVMSLGNWIFKESDVGFPVSTQQLVRPQILDTVQRIEQLEAEERSLCEEIERERIAYNKSMRKFKKRKNRYDSFLKEKGPLLESVPQDFSFR